jgi:hypothetical protein
MEMPNFRLTLDFVQQGGNSFDGDNPRPLEVATNFRISRKQITKELSAYIPIGTPALTWNAEVNKDTAKGSDIHTSARWGIAKSMDRHVPQFFDPFTKATFHTGSYVAMHLEEGINWWQFLGIQGPTPPRTVFVPMHPDYKIMIMLPELADRGRVERMAVKGVSNKAPTASAFIQMLDPAGRIFEPRKEGDFEDTGRTVYDPQNKNKSEGALGMLTSENILGNGWNQYPDHTKDPNFQKMLLINRPRDFVNRLFTKIFNDGKPYEGRITSYNKKTKYWTAQYPDGDVNEFNIEDMELHVIGKRPMDVERPTTPHHPKSITKMERPITPDSPPPPGNPGIYLAAPRETWRHHRTCRTTNDG